MRFKGPWQGDSLFGKMVCVDTTHSILRFAKRFFAGTLLSRICGALRDMAMAFCFGASPFIAAFMVAYRVANLFRRLFGEGNLQAGFIPHFESLPEKESFFFYRDTAFSMFVFLGTIVLGLETFFWFFARSASDEWAQIAHYAMWMTPGLLFICLYALNSSLLQTKKSFFLPASAPALFNIVWIAAAFFACRFPVETAIKLLSLGVVFAFAVQWAFTAIQARQILSAHLSWKEWFRPNLFSPEWKKLLRPLSLGVVGMGAVQFNTLLDAIFARVADPSGPAFLWYALRVQQLPLALFAIALTRALLPPLARAMREGALDHFRNLLQNSLQHAATLMIPCTFALFALGSSGLNLLFGRGNFTASDVHQTVHCLWGYGVGLLPSTFVLLFASGFFAKKNYALPTFASLTSVAINAIFNALFIFVFHWGALSIALATSLASFANAAVLFVFLQKKIGKIFPAGFGSYMSRLLVAAAAAFGVTALVEHLLGQSLTRNFPLQLQAFSIAAVVYLGSFLSAMRILGLWESIAILLRRTPKISGD